MVSVSVENKGAYCCLSVWRAGHSKKHVHFIYNSHPITMCADSMGLINFFLGQRTVRVKALQQALRTSSPPVSFTSEYNGLLGLPERTASQVDLSSPTE